MDALYSLPVLLEKIASPRASASFLVPAPAAGEPKPGLSHRQRCERTSYSGTQRGLVSELPDSTYYLYTEFSA